MSFGALERQIRVAETGLILLSTLSIAVADWAVGSTVSLGPLYLIPVSYSAVTRSWRLTLVLFLVCLVLRQWLGPLEQAARPWLVFTRDLLIAGAFVVVVGHLVRLSIRRREIFDIARRQRDELASELELAASVQERLLELRHFTDERFDVFARTRPLKGVGGDYYDFVELDHCRIAVVVADVAGKGLPAALLMPAVRIAMRAILERETEPAAAIRELNRTLYATTDARSYATLFFAIADLERRRLAYVNAGHVPGLLRSPDGDVVRLQLGGPPVGLLESPDYRSGEADFPEEAALVVTTDGVIEARDRAGHEFGVDRFERAARDASVASADRMADALRTALRQFRGSEDFEDDVTVVVLRRRTTQAPDQSADTPAREP